MNKTDKHRPRAVIYCRIARLDSHDSLVSLDLQEKKLIAYAEKQGYEVICLLKERGGGLSLDRPQLNAIRCMNNTIADKILVADISRIGRDFVEVYSFISELKAKGVELEASDGSQNDYFEFFEDFFKEATKFMKRQRTKKDTVPNDDTVSSVESETVTKPLIQS